MEDDGWRDGACGALGKLCLVCWSRLSLKKKKFTMRLGQQRRSVAGGSEGDGEGDGDGGTAMGVRRQGRSDPGDDRVLSRRPGVKASPPLPLHRVCALAGLHACKPIVGTQNTVATPATSRAAGGNRPLFAADVGPRPYISAIPCRCSPAVRSPSPSPPSTSAAPGC